MVLIPIWCRVQWSLLTDYIPCVLGIHRLRWPDTARRFNAGLWVGAVPLSNSRPSHRNHTCRTEFPCTPIKGMQRLLRVPAALLAITGVVVFRSDTSPTDRRPAGSNNNCSMGIRAMVKFLLSRAAWVERDVNIKERILGHVGAKASLWIGTTPP